MIVAASLQNSPCDQYPDRFFDATPYLANQFLVTYDVTADNRFLMLKTEEQPARTEVVIIRNWVQQVKARLAEPR